MQKVNIAKYLLICGTLLFATGCGDSKSTSAPSGVASTAASTVESSVAEPSPTEKPKEVDSFCFSEKSGFYKNSLDLEILCPEANAKIYYTIDGSDPDNTKTLYNGEVLTLENPSDNPNVYSDIVGVNANENFRPRSKVLKTNVIRAIAYYEDGSTSDVINGTYFVDIDHNALFGDVPVISLVTDSSNLFDYEKGIYVLGKTYDDWLKEDPSNQWKEGWQKKGNYSNKGRDWERNATITLFESDGKVGFSSNVGIRIMGAASRGSTQKSFKIFFREEYGQKNLKYELIPDNTREDNTGLVETYKSFVIRNGGNDCDYCKLRDPLLQDLVSNRSFDTQKATPVVVFLDGEYWGMYSMNELYTDNYIQYNYGIDNKNVIIVKRGSLEEGEEDDIHLYEDMMDFINNNDMSDKANYAKASEMLDMVNFAEYCAFNLYIYNQDSFFEGNNWEMWRVRNADGETAWSDGKWRMMCYDTEYSTGIYDGGGNYKTNSLNKALKQTTGTSLMLQSLLNNDEFKALFVNTLCDMANIDFESVRAREYLVKWDVLYKKLVPNTLERFGPEWLLYGNTSGYYSDRVSELRKFLIGRPDAFIDIIQKYFELEDCVNVTVTSNDFSKGSFTMNTSPITFKIDYTGRYYKEFPITINAVPCEGKTFDHWEIRGGTISDEKAEIATITATDDCTVKAIFK